MHKMKQRDYDTRVRDIPGSPRLQDCPDSDYG